MTDNDERVFAAAVEQLQREVLAQGEQIAIVAEKLAEVTALVQRILEGVTRSQTQ